MVKWSPAWAWIFLSVFVIVFVVIFDLHAYFTHGRSMTTQFRLWLDNQYSGPFIFGAWVALFAGLTFHWFQQRIGK